MWKVNEPLPLGAIVLLIVNETLTLALIGVLAFALAVKPSEPFRVAVSDKVPVVVVPAWDACTVLANVMVPLSVELRAEDSVSEVQVQLVPRMFNPHGLVNDPPGGVTLVTSKLSRLNGSLIFSTSWIVAVWS